MIILTTNEQNKTFNNVDFYLLKEGENFNFRGEKFVKINDETGRNVKTGESQHFWPSVSVKMEKSLSLEEMLTKYPELEYSY